MCRRSPLPTALLLLLLATGPTLAAREHHRRSRRPEPSRLELEAAELARSAVRLRTAVERASFPWEHRRAAVLLWAAEDFERQARRLYRSTRRRHADRWEVAERFERVERAWRHLARRLRHVPPHHRLLREAEVAREAVWEIRRRIAPRRLARAPSHGRSYGDRDGDHGRHRQYGGDWDD